MQKSPDAFRTISEVATDLDIPQHVLRFWETRFATIRPLKRGGGRRYYRPDDVDLLKGIRQLLYGHGYTIKGVQRILKDDGLRFVQAIGRGEEVASPARIEAPQDDDRDLPIDEAPAPSSAEVGPDEEPASLGDGSYVAASAPRSAPAPAAATLAPDSLLRLRAALDELLECERILGSLRSE